MVVMILEVNGGRTHGERCLRRETLELTCDLRSLGRNNSMIIFEKRIRWFRRGYLIRSRRVRGGSLSEPWEVRYEEDKDDKKSGEDGYFILKEWIKGVKHKD
ncbi:hypothetical protein Tco_1113330 [Tanacetum coccineum]|uniref:Uncharacterized protein n=1 Tax=Tanacetum coccineum TaxID=301880 RepID=A0ABQ5IRY4_9ASTR